jgi:hypothetical protein
MYRAGFAGMTVVAISREPLATSETVWTPACTLVAQGRSGIGLAVSATRAGTWGGRSA